MRVVVNRAFANHYLDDSPIGAKLPDAGYTPKEGETLESTVIGVVDDVRYVTAGDLVLLSQRRSRRKNGHCGRRHFRRQRRFFATGEGKCDGGAMEPAPSYEFPASREKRRFPHRLVHSPYRFFLHET
jgi:hypothetical protein